MIPNYVLIIGSMKSGTTTLYDYLAQHPKIAVGREKEPGFFAFEDHWAQGLDWFESKFNYDPSRHAYAIDGSTDYTKHPFCKDVVERLKASGRRFKLIYIMRHPLRRIESHARHTDITRREIGRWPSPRESHSLDAGISPVSLAISRYAHQIDVFSEFYDRGDLLLLTLEQLARDPHAVVAKVCEFLNIEALSLDHGPLKSNEAGSRSLTSPLKRRLYPAWQALRNVAPLRRAVAAAIPRSLRAQMYQAAKASAPQEGRFKLNASETAAVIETLKPDLIRLRDRYGIDIKKEWGIDV